MLIFLKNIYYAKPLTVFAKRSILGVWNGSGYFEYILL